MALVRALEESLRDLTRLYLSLLVLPSTYSCLPTSACLLPASASLYLLPTYFLPTSGLLMATSGLLMATPRGLPPAYFWTVDGNSARPTLPGNR